MRGSEILITSSGTIWSASGGRTAVPIPGMLRFFGSPPNVTEPSGSTAMTLMWGNFWRSRSATPEIVPVVPEPEWTDSLSEWADRNGVPRVESGDFADLAAVPDRRIADLAISVFYDRILSAAFIDRCGRVYNIFSSRMARSPPAFSRLAAFGTQISRRAGLTYSSISASALASRPASRVCAILASL